MFRLSYWVKEFWDSIVKNYKDWYQWEYEFVSKKTNLRIWTSNGISYMRISGQRECFWTIRERRYIYNSILKAIRFQIEDKWYMNK